MFLNNPRHFVSICLSMFCLIIANPNKAISNTPAKAPIILVLDGSGSMWGQINGKTKIKIAREVVGNLVHQMASDQPIGLVAYGHRREKDCEDIEELVPPGINNHDEINSILKKINPKGRTPLANTALRVIEKLKASNSSATIILISDGVESCGGDLCKVVQAAKTAGVDFILHIVGFDIGDSDKLALKCAAEAGDGKYIDAKNGDELSNALEETTEVKVDEVGPTTLSVKVTKDGQLHDAGVQIFKDGESVYFTSQRTYDHEDKNPSAFSIPPGTYDIRAKPLGTDADEIWKKDIVVSGEGVKEVEIDFSAGNVSIYTTTNDTPWDCVINIKKSVTGKSVSGGRTYKDGKVEYELSPGFYDIHISATKLKGAQTTHQVEKIEVVAGMTTEVSHNFQHGELSILGTNNGDFWDCVISISTDDDQKKKSVGGGRTYKSTKNNAITKLLTPGVYSVHYNPHHIHGNESEYTVQKVEVLADQVSEVVHDFQTGTIFLGARHKGAPCKFNIYGKQNGKSAYSRRAIIDKETNLAKLIFTPGTYEITITPVKVENTQPKTFTITIEHGEVVERILEF